jgi:hypothetical protein
MKNPISKAALAALDAVAEPLDRRTAEERRAGLRVFCIPDDDEPTFWVTYMDGRRRAPTSGPFPTYDEALASVRRLYH